MGDGIGSDVNSTNPWTPRNTYVCNENKKMHAYDSDDTFSITFMTILTLTSVSSWMNAIIVSIFILNDVRLRGL